jgi:hypothetical protein
MVGISLFLNGNSNGGISIILIGFVLFSVMLKWKDIKRDITWKDLEREYQNIFILKSNYRNNKVLKFVIGIITLSRL